MILYKTYFQCVVEYNGVSSDLELLGNTQNCLLIMKLLRDILNIIAGTDFQQDTACLAVLDVLKPIVNTTFLAINKLVFFTITSNGCINFFRFLKSEKNYIHLRDTKLHKNIELNLKSFFDCNKLLTATLQHTWK